MMDFNIVFWQFLTVILGIVGFVLFMLFYFVVMPPISRQFIKAKWKKGVPSMIQNDSGQVVFSMTSQALPEGVLKIRDSFYYLIKPIYRQSNKEKAVVDLEGLTKEEISKLSNKKILELRQKAVEKMIPSELNKLSKEQLSQLEATLLHVPTLAGLGKQIFFGYSGIPVLSNLKTIAHASLPAMKELFAKHRSITPLVTCYRHGFREGSALFGRGTQKLIMMALAVALPIAVLGLIVFLLTSGGGA